jgi:hypothetical protein
MRIMRASFQADREGRSLAATLRLTRVQRKRIDLGQTLGPKSGVG